MKKFLIYFGLFASLFVFVFRSLIFNITSHLIDWLDYPFIVWTIYQNVEKIKTLDFVNFFNSNAFYPNKLTLLFSDILLPQSLIALPFSYFTNNHILVFNLVFLITFILNYISSFLFWRQIFKKNEVAFFGALFTVFSPFVHLLLGHFQMLSFWPLFFSLYFLFKNEEKNTFKNSLFVGLFLAIQFLTSAYLAIFLLFTIVIYYSVRLLTKQVRLNDLKNIVLIIAVFLLIDGVFIKGYFDMKKTYQIKRDLGEYITYSAHISDYLFTTNIKSLIHQSPVLSKWNFFDKHKLGENASFPGFLLLILASLSLFKFSKVKKEYFLGLKLDHRGLFFFLLIISGLIFSFGPRLSFNGNYAHIPSIYSLFIEIPLFDAIRSLARWSFLFYFGLIYFSLAYLHKMVKKSKKTNFILFFILFAFFLEYIPLNIQTHAENYVDNRYSLLRNICSKDKKVLIEFPVTHLSAGKNIIEGLNYISKVQLASLYHKCNLVNGYSGYDLPSLFAHQAEISTRLGSRKLDSLQTYLMENGIDVIKFNPEKMIKEDKFSYMKIRDNFINNLFFIKK